MLKDRIHEKISEVFLELQEANNITSGDIYPLDALHLEALEAEMATVIEKVIAYQPKVINYDDFVPSWYIYIDSDGEVHSEAFGQITEDQFFIKVSHRICFDDCTDKVVQKIYYKGKEVEYVGWRPNMVFEYKDLNGNVVWSGKFEHWDH